MGCQLDIVGSITDRLHAVFNRFAKEFFEKQAIKKQFAGYCSPTVVKMLQENPKLIKEGTKREISICFSDLRGFTPLGESFGDDVKGLTRIMNGYMDAITKPILDADGMVIHILVMHQCMYTMHLLTIQNILRQQFRQDC